MISTKEQHLIDIKLELLDGITEKNLTSHRWDIILSDDRSLMIVTKDATHHTFVNESNTDSDLGKSLQLWHDTAPC
jgi:hypothetical protein